ncbi:MAG: hypothetical protein ACE37F_27585 [Nannocystaceae bacterium]|nr:hypothetical protein [bacterium]
MPRLGHWTLSALPALLSACFIGDAADGLPCEQDADCGLGVACAVDDASGQRCCGGACLSSQTSSVTDSTTGSSSTTAGPTSSTAGPSSSESSTTATTLGSQCGNGTKDPGEDCDEDNPNCVECMYVQACGNGGIDVEEGEVCDPWNLPDGEACADGCRTWTALSWDQDASSSETQRDFPASLCDDGDDSCIEWRTDGAGAFVSGLYFPDGTAPALMRWPEAVLFSRSITFPSLSQTDTVTIDVRHAHAFNADVTTFLDHAVVALVPAGALDDPEAWIRVLPVPGSGEAESIACTGAADGCMLANGPEFCDLADEEAFAGVRLAGPSSRTLSGDLVSETTYRLAFRVRYDCANFGEPEVTWPDDAWTVESAEIVVERGAG